MVLCQVELISVPVHGRCVDLKKRWFAVPLGHLDHSGLIGGEVDVLTVSFFETVFENAVKKSGSRSVIQKRGRLLWDVS